MISSQCGNEWELHAPAKLNLHLEILARRDDGFHEIETLMAPVSIYDTLRFSPQASCAIELHARWAEGMQAQWGSMLGDLPPAEQNLVVRALELLRQESGADHGATVELIKRIPSQAGLGGASTDAAAALLAANAGWRLGWSVDRLAEVAAKLGSDIPFFLYGGAAICRGRGERIERIGRLPPLHVVVVRPPEGLSTPQVYRGCRVPEQPIPAQPLLNALCRGDAAGIERHLVNRLQEPAERLSPWIARLRTAFFETDCWGSQMSGSGSSYFGIYRSSRQARRAAQHFRGRNLGWVACGTAGGGA